MTAVSAISRRCQLASLSESGLYMHSDSAETWRVHAGLSYDTVLLT